MKQVMTIPIDDHGEEDLYSHLSDVIQFIGKKRMGFTGATGVRC